jgi:hypothetical protein
MRSLRLLLLAVLLCQPALAIKEYYSLSRSYRALAMGNAFYGLSDDEQAVFYNPAGTALFPGSAQFLVSFGGEAASDLSSSSTTVTNAFKGGDVSTIASSLESLTGKPLYAGGKAMVSFLTRGFEVGILVADAKADLAVQGRDLSTSLDATALGDSGVFINKSGRIANNLYAGLTAKLLARAGGRKMFSVVDISQGTKLELKDMGGAGLGADADLGFTYLMGRPGNRVTGGLSMVFSNLLASSYSIYQVSGGGAPPELPRYGSIGGFALVRGGKVIDNLRFELDIAELNLGGQRDTDLGRRTGRFWKHLNFGMEIPVGGWLALRGGFHQGDYTLGMGLNLRVLRLDFVTYAEELDSEVDRLSSRRYALQLSFGFGVPPAGASATTSPTRGRRSE